jgi:uncharacterized surface protein with fasciclin (FAS1) repeats
MNRIAQKTLMVGMIALAATVLASHRAEARSAASASCPSSRLQTDIIDTAVGAGQFKTLAAAVDAAGLIPTLKSAGPFTVFAPNDAAFAKLPAGTVEGLLNDIPTLTKILTYHVVAGEFSEMGLLKAGQVATVQGQEVMVQKSGGKLFINNSEVLATIKVSNGVIYVIDSVLLP